MFFRGEGNVPPVAPCPCAALRKGRVKKGRPVNSNTMFVNLTLQLFHATSIKRSNENA